MEPVSLQVEESEFDIIFEDVWNRTRQAVLIKSKLGQFSQVSNGRGNLASQRRFILHNEIFE